MRGIKGKLESGNNLSEKNKNKTNKEKNNTTQNEKGREGMSDGSGRI